MSQRCCQSEFRLQNPEALMINIPEHPGTATTYIGIKMYQHSRTGLSSIFDRGDQFPFFATLADLRIKAKKASITYCSIWVVDVGPAGTSAWYLNLEGFRHKPFYFLGIICG